MAAHDQTSRLSALVPLLPELSLRPQESAAMLILLRTIAAAREPVALAQGMLRSLEALVNASWGAAIYAGSQNARLLATSKIEPALAARLATILPAVGRKPVCLDLEALAIDAETRAGLLAASAQALLVLPLIADGERIGLALLLLPVMHRLTPPLAQVLQDMAGAVAVAFAAVWQWQALAAQNDQRTAELAALREQLVSEQEARSQAEAMAHATRQQLEQRRGRDAVTGLISGRHFHSRLEVEVERARRYRDELGLLLLDIDTFRDFNDAYGREAGDRVLARLGEILRQELRKVDHAFRYGGEEFTAILPRCGPRVLLSLAERLRQRIAAESFPVDAQAVQLSVSIGAAAYRHGAPVESFIRSVDDALYRAKAEGRNRVVLA